MFRHTNGRTSGVFRGPSQTSVMAGVMTKLILFSTKVFQKHT